MIKILTIVGARPQFIKAATLSRCIAKHYKNKIEEVIVHSGQHYDKNMSEKFFDELEIPKPKYQFEINESPHLDKVSQMKNNIELAIQNENPDVVVLYGDTNTTLAGTYAASNLNIPIAHIEAGLRSYDESMPEEFNRYTCDHASTFLFAPTEKAIQNLEDEGAPKKNKKPYHSENPAVFLSGDIMLDGFKFTKKRIKDSEETLDKFNLTEEEYLLVTIHRNFNTDKPSRLNNIIKGLIQLSKEFNIKIVFPLHPRTKNQIEKHLKVELKKEAQKSKLDFIDPITHEEIIALGLNSKMIVTDSGGLQKEAFFMEKPCLITRSNSEWTEIIENGNAILVDDKPENLIKAYRIFDSKKDLNFPSFYGNGKAAKLICKKLYEYFSEVKEQVQ